MTRNLEHPGYRVDDQVLVALDEDPGLGPPERVVGEKLVDHSLAQQFLKRDGSLAHQRKNHVAQVAERIDRQSSTRAQERANERPPS